MRCLFPAVRSAENRPLVVTPCGRCMPCRINRREEWTARILLESQDHSHNWFVTLTYDDQHLPADRSLQKSDAQKWLKRFRYEVAPTRIRYFLCGEYGSKTARPHYHALLFTSLPDIQDALSKSWTLGFTTCAPLTPERARYTAQYTTKKVIGSGKFADGRNPEFLTMSRRPGLGANWLQKIDPNTPVQPSVKLYGKSYPMDRYLRTKLNIGVPNGQTIPEIIERVKCHEANCSKLDGYDPSVAKEIQRKMDKEKKRHLGRSEKI